MPRQVTISREAILAAALELIREEGPEALAARGLAKRLGCSTQPIFSNFAGMEELRRAVDEAAYARYLAHLKEEMASSAYPVYKASGMAYIHFAREERQLFRLIFMQDRRLPAPESEPLSEDMEMAMAHLMQSHGWSRDLALRFHAEMWIVVHGLAVMIATNYMNWPEETVSEFLSDFYWGLLARFGGDANERH